jgi:hypothetical protein
MATNIPNHVMNSFFDALRIDKKDFVFPTTVYVSDEHVDKSSVVETLTHHAVFPPGTCTKMPIRIEMVQTKTDVCFQAKHGHFNVTTTDTDVFKSMLEEYMTSMTTIVDEEMVVKIESPYVITGTVIDLPGIRAHPEEMAMATRRIADKYLLDPDTATIPICVVPAKGSPSTIPACIGLLKSYGKENFMIIHV